MLHQQQNNLKRRLPNYKEKCNDTNQTETDTLNKLQKGVAENSTDISQAHTPTFTPHIPAILSNRHCVCVCVFLLNNFSFGENIKPKPQGLELQ